MGLDLLEKTPASFETPPPRPTPPPFPHLDAVFGQEGTVLLHAADTLAYQRGSQAFCTRRNQ